ncbi:MAG: lipoate--protein ligase family protein [Microbacteriaceae bacterium]|nr:lipoate--protein ligase family protein [Microbacteriaceae bacterium]
MIDGGVESPVCDDLLPATVRLGESGGLGAFDDMYLATELLRFTASHPGVPHFVRAYRPEPTVAFSRKESLLPGFAAALTAAASFGFTPVIRPTGGRAVAMDQSCLVIDVIDPMPRRHEGHRLAYARVAGALATALESLGVDARVGEVSGEFCPGEFSVNARGVVKVVGISQRVISGARLVSAMVAIEQPGVLPAVLAEVNRELDFAWRIETFGSVATEVGAVDFSAVSEALQNSLCIAADREAGVNGHLENALRNTARNIVEVRDLAPVYANLFTAPGAPAPGESGGAH